MHMLPLFKTIEEFKRLIVTRFTEIIGQENFKVYDFLNISKVAEHTNRDERVIAYSQNSVRFEFQQKGIKRLSAVVKLENDRVFLSVRTVNTPFEVTDPEFAALLKFFVSFFITYSKERKTNASNEVINADALLLELGSLLRQETTGLSTISVTRLGQITHGLDLSFTVLGEDEKGCKMICEVKVLSHKTSIRILKNYEGNKPAQVETITVKNKALSQRLIAIYVSINIIMF